MESICRIFTSCLLVDVKFEEAVPELILVVEVARCRIEEVRGVVQVFQNWFRGITNPSRSS